MVPPAFHAPHVTGPPGASFSISCPVPSAKTRANLSSQPVASWVPPEFHATDETGAPCPNFWSSSPVATSGSLRIALRGRPGRVHYKPVTLR